MAEAREDVGLGAIPRAAQRKATEEDSTQMEEDNMRKAAAAEVVGGSSTGREVALFVVPEEGSGSAGTPASLLPPTDSIKYIESLLDRQRSQQKIKSSGPASVKGVVTYNHEWTKKKEVAQALQQALPKPKNIVRLLGAEELLGAQVGEFKDISGKIRSMGELHFLLLQRVDREGTTWMLPTSQQFHDIINEVECTMIANNRRIADLSLIHI